MTAGTVNLVDDDLGPWLTTAQAAKLLGRTADEVRVLCEDRRIDHQRIEAKVGDRFKYRISEQAVKRFLRRHVIRAAS